MHWGRGYFRVAKWVIMAVYCPFSELAIIDPVYEAIMTHLAVIDPFSVINKCIMAIIDPA